MKGAREAYRKAKGMPELCEDVDNSLEQAGKIMKRIAECSDNRMAVIWKECMHGLRAFCASSAKVLEEIYEEAKSWKRLRRMRKAPNRTESLNEIRGELEKLQRGAMSLDGRAKIIEEMRKMRVARGDAFRAKRIAPPNHGGLFLSVGDESAFEGKLKHLALREKASSAGAIGAIREKAIVASAHGMSGAGKTCAVKAAGSDREV